MPEPRREQLPSRRPRIAEEIEFADTRDGVTRYPLACGFDRPGRLGEIFVDGTRSDGERKALLDHAAIPVSIALQAGSPFDCTALRLACEASSEPASLHDALLNHAVAIAEAGA